MAEHSLNIFSANIIKCNRYSSTCLTPAEVNSNVYYNIEIPMPYIQLFYFSPV